jgi:hypothetical protein
MDLELFLDELQAVRDELNLKTIKGFFWKKLKRRNWRLEWRAEGAYNLA